MQPVVIRQATALDLKTINRFQQGIVTAERPFDRTVRDGEVRYYDIAALLASEEVMFVVAEAGVEPVGCGFVRIEAAKPYLKHSKHGYLGLMYVDPAYRGRSINGKIIDALKTWSRARGITELRLEVYRDNDTAVRAYEKAGFRPLILEMRLGLGDENL
jgi:ribosomal protein S18 acetylase RimI-like enzyme